MATKRQLEMVKEYQCAGCVAGHNPEKCESFALFDSYGFACTGHVLGTSILGMHGGSFALGLPRGFCKAGYETGPGGNPTKDGRRNMLAIRLWTDGALPIWNSLNVPVWALEQDGVLFVRTFSPRTNLTFVDVVDGGKRAELCPTAIDVATFIGEID